MLVLGFIVFYFQSRIFYFAECVPVPSEAHFQALIGSVDIIKIVGVRESVEVNVVDSSSIINLSKKRGMRKYQRLNFIFIKRLNEKLSFISKMFDV